MKHIYFLCSQLAAMAIDELAAEEVRASLRIDYAGVISAEIDTFGTTEQDAEQVSEWAGPKLAMLLETYGGTDKCTRDDNESGDF